ncbi:site-specific integrase [Nocardia nova]|uniref:Site-specific integrase n=2 Tax=Nocardiaceae TaxID=85025 RepID=A0A2T2Z870_9NOCA|nr:site-specific integrase [Nocardia nova]
MSSLRIGTRRDGSTYTQILFREFDPAKGRKVQSSLSFDEHADAVRWQKILDQVGPEQTRKMLAVEDTERAKDVVTLATFAPTYIAGRTGVEKATRDRYTSYLENDMGALADLPLEALCAASADENSPVQDWVNDMEADGASGKTIANKHGFLSGCLKAAVKRRLIPFNPCEDTKLPPRHYEPCFLEPEEFDLLYDAVPKRWRPMVLFLVTTGVRYSEATALHVRDFGAAVLDSNGEPESYTCRVARAWKYTGTAEKRLGGPKSKRGIRTINVPAETVAKLGLENRAAGELLFPTQNGGRISSQLFHNKCWRTAVEKLAAEVGKRPRPHDLRHTCASWMINNGAELTDVQGHLGHESITTTVGVYGHLDRRSGKRASTAISKALVRTAVRGGAA